jgi:two-component system cell cycle sensor histidine kinase/response regulator CckA
VYGIVKQSGGEVWVESEPNRGTSIKVCLPCATTTGEPATAEVPVRRTGEERLLVVEDERPVRELLARVLRRHGYTVSEAEDGRQALAMLRAAGGHFELLITDIVMPHMGGRELAGQVADIWPAMRVLFISGYAGLDAFASGVVRNGEHFLQKPFSNVALAAKVREVLDTAVYGADLAPASVLPH